MEEVMITEVFSEYLQRLVNVVENVQNMLDGRLGRFDDAKNASTWNPLPNTRSTRRYIVQNIKREALNRQKSSTYLLKILLSQFVLTV